jgi:hypothetical protein
VNFDPSNAIVAGDDPLAVLAAVKERVVTMHASDRYLTSGTIEDLKQQDGSTGYARNLKHGVIGKGLNDYDAIFSTLRAQGSTAGCPSKTARTAWTSCANRSRSCARRWPAFLSTQRGEASTLVEHAPLPEAHRRRLFVASCMALIATAVTFAIRGDILGDLGTTFSSATRTGQGGGGLGLRLHALDLHRRAARGPARHEADRLCAFLMHVLGVALTSSPTASGCCSRHPRRGPRQRLVEAFVNPLTATIYADQKTEKLNLLHVWFPGGHRHRRPRGLCLTLAARGLAREDGLHPGADPSSTARSSWARSSRPRSASSRA